MGLSWFVASLGVYVRDVGQVTSMFTTILLFMSGIFYPTSALPGAVPGVDAFQSVELTSSRKVETRCSSDWYPISPDLRSISVGGAAIAWLGFAWFQRSRKGFADVV